MSRWELETFRARPRPVVLAIGCDPDLAAKVHSAAALVGAIVREADHIASAVTIATQSKPLAIVLPASMNAKYADDFAALAREVDATLVPIPDGDIGQTDLEKLLYDAVAKTSAISAAKDRP